ncbi:hypothetical protein GCM10010975_28130 [Comamonas phosphati]|nr:hypothetical protein GCM10010975_28130 [Comamonas phosphati]
MSYFPWNRPEQQKQPHDTATHHWRPGIVALAAAMALSACNDKDSPIKADSTALAPAATPEAAQLQPAAYAPPSANVLYQMVAPIALYPDKLVAQILAGSTYPNQIGAAETWMGQNPGLRKTALANAVNAQNWDPSVKSLTQFPNVLEQMASNLPWTTALGKAYYNDPSDVMNAIQVMRNRAYKAGTLKTSKQLKVNVASTPSAVAYTPGAVVTPLPDPVIAPPEQFIEIVPSQVDIVYVPQYAPDMVYGEPLPVYGGYRYVEVPPPPPVVGVPVVAGLLGFGVGVVLAESMDRYPSWGWNSWDMHWGDHDRPWRYGDRPPPPQALPAVVYNTTTYISQSHTVVQNIHRTDNTYVNNVYQNGALPMPAPTQAALPMQQQSAGAFAPQHGLQPGTLAAGAAGAAVGAAVLAAGSHAWNQRQQQSPLAAVPQGRPGFGQGQPPATPAMPHAPNGNAFMQLRDQRSQDHSAGPDRQPQAPLMQAAMAGKNQQQMQPERAQEQVQRQQQMQQQAQAREQQQRQQRAQMQQAQQQRAQEQAQRQQQMQQQAQAREQQQRQQQAQMQQAQQQRTQEQAQRQQQMQQQAQAREQQQRQEQAQMQQAQQQRAQEQAQRQQQMQQQAQAREQQQRQQQAQMQQAQQQRAQEQAQRQQQMQQQAQAREQQQRQQQAQIQQMQQRAQEQTQRQAEQQSHMQTARAEARANGDHDRR